MDDIPDQDEITAIVQDAASGAVVNHRITHNYHRLSQAIRLHVNAGPNLDWCGFAKWASHTVGLDLDPHLVGAELDELAQWILEFLPTELLQAGPPPASHLETGLLLGELLQPGFLASHLEPRLLLNELLKPGSLARRLEAGLLSPELLRDALHAVIVKLLQREVAVDGGLVMNALRLGNAAIFREMGSVFMNLAQRLPERSSPTAESDQELAEDIVKFVHNTPPKFIAPGLEDTLIEVDKDPQDISNSRLVKGIEFYLRAEREPEHRDELMLAGNMSFTMYEQARANRLIAIGTCAPARARLLPVIDALSETPVSHEHVLLAGPGEDPALIRGVVDAVTEKLTDVALVVEIADTRVHLGHPERLPPPQVTPTLHEVAEVMDEVKLGAVNQAPNWIYLNYRLGFIGQYFAAFQQNPDATREPDPPA